MKKLVILLTSTLLCFSNVGAAPIIINQIEYETIWDNENLLNKNVRVKKVPTYYNGGIAFPETIELFGDTYTVTEIGDGTCQPSFCNNAIMPIELARIPSNWHPHAVIVPFVPFG